MAKINYLQGNDLWEDENEKVVKKFSEMNEIERRLNGLINTYPDLKNIYDKVIKTPTVKNLKELKRALPGNYSVKEGEARKEVKKYKFHIMDYNLRLKRNS